MSDDSTVVLTSNEDVLSSSEKEAQGLPPCLLVVGGELNGSLFDLQIGVTLLGRAANCDITIDFPGISRQHTEFKVALNKEIQEYFVQIKDLNSRNGTYLNNQKIEGQKALQKGDIIKIGKMALKFLPAGDPERLTYDKLNYEAQTDGLTQCFNKKFFNDRIDLEVKRSRISGEPLSLILFDIDFFKKLNDSYGHDAGDFVLKDLAQVIREKGVREDDIFCRYGGEEFTIILLKTNLKNGHDLAERIRDLVEKHKFIYENQRLPVTISIGIADYREGVDSGNTLFKRVDKALYKSKDAGRNTVTFYKE